MNIKEFFSNFNNNFLGKNQDNFTASKVGKFAQGIALSISSDGTYYWDDIDAFCSGYDMIIRHSKYNVFIKICWYKRYEDICLKGCKYIFDISVSNGNKLVYLNNDERAAIACAIEDFPVYGLAKHIAEEKLQTESVKYFESYAEKKNAK